MTFSLEDAYVQRPPSPSQPHLSRDQIVSSIRHNETSYVTRAIAEQALEENQHHFVRSMLQLCRQDTEEVVAKEKHKQEKNKRRGGGKGKQGVPGNKTATCQSNTTTKRSPRSPRSPKNTNISRSARASRQSTAVAVTSNVDPVSQDTNMTDVAREVEASLLAVAAGCRDDSAGASTPSNPSNNSPRASRQPDPVKVLMSKSDGAARQVRSTASSNKDEEGSFPNFSKSTDVRTTNTSPIPQQQQFFNDDNASFAPSAVDNSPRSGLPSRSNKPGHFDVTPSIATTLTANSHSTAGSKPVLTLEQELARNNKFTMIQALKKQLKKAEDPLEIGLEVARLYVELEMQKMSIPFFLMASKVVPYKPPAVHPQDQELEDRKRRAMGAQQLGRYLEEAEAEAEAQKLEHAERQRVRVRASHYEIFCSLLVIKRAEASTSHMREWLGMSRNEEERVVNLEVIDNHISRCHDLNDMQVGDWKDKQYTEGEKERERGEGCVVCELR